MDPTAPTSPTPSAPAPQAPLFARRPPTPNWATRLIALAVFAPTLAVLLTASSLAADPQGMGTHTQLGLTPCGFKAATGLPCATCGMTTAFTHAAHGRLFAAGLTQPAGLVLAVLTAMAVILSGWSLATAMPLNPLGAALWRPRVVLTFIALILGGWLYTVIKTVVVG